MTSEGDNRKINNNNEKFIDNLNRIQIEQSTINGNNDIITITQRYSNDERVINQKTKTNKEKNKEDRFNNQIIIPQNNNSISLLINELENKEKNERENREINNINIFPNKNIKDNCIVIKGGKNTNNFNININYLTIAHKLLSPKDNCIKIINGITPLNNKLNPKGRNNGTNTNKILAKIGKKENTNNSFIKYKQISTKKINNYIESAPQKIIKDKKKSKNSTLTLPPPAKNVNKNKKFMKINPNTIKIHNYNQINNDIKNRDKQLKEKRSKSVFRWGYNSGSTTNLHKYKNVNISDNNKFGKFTIYTNNTNNNNYIQNIINYGSIKISNNLNHINYSKNILLLSADKEKRSINNMHKKPKKVFNSIMKFNDGYIKYLKITNNKEIENHNDISPIINNMNKREPLYNKLNIRDHKVKELQCKKRDLNLNKFLNIPHKKIRVKSTGK